MSYVRFEQFLISFVFFSRLKSFEWHLVSSRVAKANNIQPKKALTNMKQKKKKKRCHACEWRDLVSVSTVLICSIGHKNHFIWMKLPELVQHRIQFGRIENYFQIFVGFCWPILTWWLLSASERSNQRCRCQDIGHRLRSLYVNMTMMNVRRWKRTNNTLWSNHVI